MKTVPEKILVVRNDKLGDFMLSYPCFDLLKQYLPDTEIHALVQAYTKPMAGLCKSIDRVQIDPGKAAGFKGILSLARALRQEKYDAVITLYSTTRIGLALLLAGIPYRLAPATKLAQLFYNKRLKQRRSRSLRPEYLYNRDLAEKFLQDWQIPLTDYPSPPYLEFGQEEIQTLRDDFFRQHHVPPASKLVFIHPGSGGSANNLSVAQFARLARHLTGSTPWRLVITAGPGEEQQARQLARLTEALHPIVYISQQGLPAFSRLLALADVFISGSTGPLHIAGALDRPTAGFYTRRRSATSLRWQTLNSEARRLAFSPPEEAETEDMSQVDIPSAAEVISRKFL